MKPVRYDEGEARRYVAAGFWDNTTFCDYWDRNANENPNKEGLVDDIGSRLTWAQAKQQIDRIALAFVKVLKLERDDKVIIQLPNCVEQVLARLACEKAGLLSICLQTTYRSTEVTEINKILEANCMVIPKEYRGFDHHQMVKEIQHHLPKLKHIVVVADEVPPGCVSLKEMAGFPYEEEYSVDDLSSRRIDAIEEVGLLATTTGTTGLPKIIEQRIASRVWMAKTYNRNLGLTADDVIVTIAPLVASAGGLTGYFSAPVAGAKVALVYQYSDDTILEFIERERATAFAVVPAQLARMLQLPIDKYDLSSLRFLRVSGAYLPPAMAQEAEEKFGCPILNYYGGQDTGPLSGVSISDSKEMRYTTIGKPHLGNEIKVLNDAGEIVKPGEVGLLYFRSPGSPIGYYRDPEKTRTEAFDEEGWACPGDLVIVTDDGYIKIMGRKKDIIIRGGQNIYAKEIEDYLIGHPKVVSASVVAMPDPVMGEKACAFVVPKTGEQFTFDEMVDYLKGEKIAMFKLPERLEIIEALPLEAGIKVNKVLLRKIVADKLKAEGKIK